MAVVSVVCGKYIQGTPVEQLGQLAEKLSNEYLEKWPKFESNVSGLEHNAGYFTPYIDSENQVRYEMNWDNYYKGRNLNQDLKNYFK